MTCGPPDTIWQMTTTPATSTDCSSRHSSLWRPTLALPDKRGGQQHEIGAKSMPRRYVILGNGIAGQTAAEELRKLEPDSSVVMIAAERHPLYNRVALPRYLRGQVRSEEVFMGP